MEKFIAGLAMGAAVGALLVANSAKTRSLIKKSQDELKTRVDEYLDEKLAAMDKSASKSAGATASEN